MKIRDVKFRTPLQGAILVNHGYVRHKAKKVAILEFDLRSKYAQVFSYGGGEHGPMVMLQADERTLHLNEEVPRDELTMIEFKGFKKWSVYMADVSRYTLQVVLVKE